MHNLLLFFCYFFPDLAAQLDTAPADADRWAAMVADPSTALQIVADYFVRPCLRINIAFMKEIEACDESGESVDLSDPSSAHYLFTDSRVTWTLNGRYRLIWSMTERFLLQQRVTGHSELYLEVD